MKPTLAALAAALLLALPALAQEAPTPTLTANGDGTVMVTPNIAVVSLGVATRGETASAALAQNSADLAAAIGAVKAEGVADKDIGTANFSIDPVYEQLPERTEPDARPARIVGYQVTNTVRVTIRDIGKSGGILDKVVSAGANQVTGIGFDVADRTSSEDAALAAAIVDARRKAALMAEAAGVKLVRILSVSASEAGGPAPMFARALAASPPPIMPGEQSVSVSATVTYEIAPQ